MKVCVLGAGSWGTALAILISSNGFQVTLWDRDDAAAADLSSRRENLRYLPGCPLPGELEITADISHACSNAGLIVVAVPSSAVDQVCQLFAGLVSDHCVVLNAAKGLDPMTHGRLSDTICASACISQSKVAALSGPNLALELARGVPTAGVVASADSDSAETCRCVLASPSFRIYTSEDIVGVELGGALKNVYAIAAGICEGMGYGDNTKAALLTRGLAEMTRLGVAFGSRPQTFLGLSGVGDLIATSSSKLSRNLRVGLALGSGVSLDDALEQIGQVAEGVPSTSAAVALAQDACIEMPIAEELHAVLFSGRSPMAALENLMTRTGKDELD